MPLGVPPRMGVPADPLFGRPEYMGTAPRMSVGTEFKEPSPPLRAPAYEPASAFEDQKGAIQDGDDGASARHDWLRQAPVTINVGDSGRSVDPTYEPHDFAPAARMVQSFRAAPQWGDYNFGSFLGFRSLFIAQQLANRFPVLAATQAMHPLRAADYFLGHTTDPSAAARIGASGNVGPVLGYN